MKSIGVRLGETIRGGSGSTVAPAEVGRSLREAHYALQVCRLEGWTFAGFEDLGTYRLLLSMADPDALRAFADSLLGPLDAYDRDQHGELLPSLQAFIQHNSRWETASAELFVHRHTLRYRMRKVEELTGRDLSSSFDRMEFWLALRARDLMASDPHALSHAREVVPSVQPAGAPSAFRRVAHFCLEAAYWRPEQRSRGVRFRQRGGEHGRQLSDVHQRRVGELVGWWDARRDQPGDRRRPRERPGGHRGGREPRRRRRQEGVRDLVRLDARRTGSSPC